MADDWTPADIAAFDQCLAYVEDQLTRVVNLRLSTLDLGWRPRW